MKRRILFTLLASAACLLAEVRLPAVLSDNMLLQRSAPVRIWGQADPGEAVTVKFRTQSVSATADNLGRWAAYLAPLEAGGPDELTVQGANTITLKNVLVGDVWVASGQSNMEWPMSRVRDSEKEIAAANFPRIRLFHVKQKVSDYPLDDVTGSWAPCTPESVGSFSAVAYFFARHLEAQLKVPIGVIEADWGGTPAESWTSMPALTADPALLYHLRAYADTLDAYPASKARYELALKAWEKSAAAAKAEGRPEPRRPWEPASPENNSWAPAGLFNAMIAPLTPYAIRGAIWYQGESNAGPERGPLYQRLFETMIRDWRRAWGQGEFPFFFVQLANYGKVKEDNRWALIREAQLRTLGLRNTGMAVTIDIGDSGDIHPRNKQDVGLRLALAARAVAYGEKVEYSGPIFRQMTAEGSALRLWFDQAAGLKSSTPELQGFQVAGQNRKFVPATARIEGGTVVVSSADVEKPVAVRYGWSADPVCTLFNAAGLPASPFRTDFWPE